MFSKAFPVVEIPKDKEGYCKSFSVNQEEEYRQFLDEYGFVVVDNVLSPEEVDETVKSVWDFLENTKFKAYVDGVEPKVNGRILTSKRSTETIQEPGKTIIGQMPSGTKVS